MPFNCDVCGNEVSYSEPVFTLRNGAEIVICTKCLRKAKKDKSRVSPETTDASCICCKLYKRCYDAAVNVKLGIAPGNASSCLFYKPRGGK
jgi:hypothetical protein